MGYAPYSAQNITCIVGHTIVFFVCISKMYLHIEKCKMNLQNTDSRKKIYAKFGTLNYVCF